MLEYQNIKMFLQNVFVIKEVRKTVLRTYVISDLKGEETAGMFYDKELQNKKSKRI